MSVVGTKKLLRIIYHSLHKMPSAAEIKQRLEAAREAARREEEKLAREMAEAEEAERVAAEAEAKRLAEEAETRRVAEAEAARVAEEARRQALIRARVSAEAGSSQGAVTSSPPCWHCVTRKEECVRSP